MYKGYLMPANRLQTDATSGLTTSCKIYDVFQTDLSKKILKECESRTEAANFLKIRSCAVSNIIKAKSRHKNKALGITITIR